MQTPENVRSTPSSLISEVSYNRKQSTMLVAFHSGAKYVYTNVPLGTFNEFVAAPSLGSYFSKNIRKNPAFSCEKVSLDSEK